MFSDYIYMYVVYVHKLIKTPPILNFNPLYTQLDAYIAESEASYLCALMDTLLHLM